MRVCDGDGDLRKIIYFHRSVLMFHKGSKSTLKGVSATPPLLPWRVMCSPLWVGVQGVS